MCDARNSASPHYRTEDTHLSLIIHALGAQHHYQCDIACDVPYLSLLRSNTAPFLQISLRGRFNAFNTTSAWSIGVRQASKPSHAHTAAFQTRHHRQQREILIRGTPLFARQAREQRQFRRMAL